MKKKKLNIRQQIANFDAGLYDNPDLDTQIDAGWFDWFCRDTSLAVKTQNLFKKLKSIVNSGKFDPEKTYVFFKNNCPMMGNLYDSFSICDIETQDVIFWITPASGYRSEKGEAQVVSAAAGFEKPVAKGSWTDVKNWFNS